ncbi:MAG TPA: class I SAM-dependent methyltransferase [Pseudonocardiaceae bacterium]|nr:class I SAM-dependent methyltransferase [Pseudonocardiaceae bacterium]
MYVTPDARTAVDEVVARTRRWYDTETAAFVERTAGYERFPGLSEEILRFVESIVDGSGPVLDLGCGAGRDTGFLLDHRREVVAGDISATMLRTTADRYGRSRPRCVQFDMRRLPFATRSFAGAWVCASLIHIPESALGDCLAELYRTLRRRAVVAISMKAGTGCGWQSADRDQGQRWLTLVRPESFLASMAAQGFVDLSTTWSGRGSWFIAHGRTP